MHKLLLIPALAATAALSAAQQQSVPDGTSYQKFGQPKPVFTPIDQGIDARTRLSSSLRVPFKDLRLPTNFDREYRVDPSYRPHGLRSRTGFFARASAGIVAVYPQPLYRGVAPGVEQIAIPPGTVYLFADSAKLTGHRATRFETEPTQPSLLQRLDASDPARSQSTAMSVLNEPLARQASVVSRMTAQTIPQRDSSAAELSEPDSNPILPKTIDGPSIWTDESLRQSRVASLLAAAFDNAPR